MSTLELQAEIAKKIFNIENEEILNEISNIVKKLTAKAVGMPGIPTEKEINERADYFLSAYEEFRKGDKSKFTSQEELEKKHRQLS